MCTCGQKMKAPAGAAGKTYRCVKCGERITVTQEMLQPRKDPAPAAGELPPARELMGQLLLDAGIIKPEHLQQALEAQAKEGGKLFEVLIRLGHLKKDALHDFLSRQPGVAGIDLRRVEIDRKLLEIIPREMALECLLLPIDRLGKLLTVAMACPLDRDSIERMEQLTGLKVKALLCKLDDIHAAVQKYFPSGASTPVGMATFGLSVAPAAPKKDLGDVLARLEALAPSQLALDHIRAVAADPAKGIADLSAAAGEDPVAAALLLRVANTAGFGLQGAVDSVPMAVALLGKEGVLAALPDQGASDRAVTTELNRRSLRAAKMAAALAQVTDRVGAGLAQTAGLIHLLGAYALATAAEDRYAEVDMTRTTPELAVSETRALGMNHAEAAFGLAVKWRFPDALCQVLRHSLAPQNAQALAYLATLVFVAAFIASQEGKISIETLEPCRIHLKTLEIDPATALRLCQNL